MEIFTCYMHSEFLLMFEFERDAIMPESLLEARNGGIDLRWDYDGLRVPPERVLTEHKVSKGWW